MSTEEGISLYVTSESFVLIKNESILEITFTEQIPTKKSNFDETQIQCRRYDICGIVGIMEGFKEKYLVVISSVQAKGQIMDSTVYAIENTICLNFDNRKACQLLDNPRFTKSTQFNYDGTNNEYERPRRLLQPHSFLSRIKSTFAKNGNYSSELEDCSADHILSRKEGIMECESDMAASADVDDIVIENIEPGRIIPPSVSSLSSLLNTDEESDNSDSDDPEEVDNEEEVLEKRLIKQVAEIFKSSMFLFSDAFDITNSFQRAHEMKKNSSSLATNSDVPLWKKVDKRFWWNEYMIQDFIKQGLDDWIIPIVQGTVQIEPSQIEGFAFDFILISRRSRERAGMRYQRRGVNEEGQVANFVETEQIVVFKKNSATHIASFVQVRGSIPLFWSQSPYSLHPIPVLNRTENENKEAFQKHINTQNCLYGNLTLISLVELVGREAIVGSEYRRFIENLSEPNVKYVEFDFHKETKGMRFENVTKLSKSLQDDFAKMQYFWEMIDEDSNMASVYSEQSGVFRTNCMDCLDRTNVVQSALGRSVLNIQLMRFGISEYPEQGIKYYNDFERIFNEVWANNGDMISRMYAGTSALKGDFTRTGKRNITGMMNDASNSLARMYHNTIKDFWRQATVDYILGYHKAEIFRHVPQSSKMSIEPGFEKRWAKIRLEAIDISSEIVIADKENFLAGWTLLTPIISKSIFAKIGSRKRASLDEKEHDLVEEHFDEKVVLLTEKALYVCKYNYKMEKVTQFRRISLDTLVSIQMGEYIVSSLTPVSRSADWNYGFIVCHERLGETQRWNTGSLLNRHDDVESEVHMASDRETAKTLREEVENTMNSSAENRNVIIGPKETIAEKRSDEADPRADCTEAIIFRAIRSYAMLDLGNKIETCKQQVNEIVQTLTKACDKEDDPTFIIHKPIVSLEQAEKTDGIFKKMGYKLKRAIWI